MTKIEILKCIILGICILCGIAGIITLFVAGAMIEGVATVQEVMPTTITGIILCGIFLAAMHLNHRER